MPITMRDLTAHLADEDQAGLLADWQWLEGADRAPILVTAMGNAVLLDAADGTVHLLDTQRGEIGAVASSIEEFNVRLTQREFVAHVFAVDVVSSLLQSHEPLAPGQVWGFRTPLVLGGDYAPENVEAVDLCAHFSILGQVHQQVRELPAGARLTGLAPDGGA
jgi:hypothetical protein